MWRERVIPLPYPLPYPLSDNYDPPLGGYIAQVIPDSGDPPVIFAHRIDELRERFGEFYEARYTLAVLTAWRRTGGDMRLFDTIFRDLLPVTVRSLRGVIGTVRQR